MRVAFLIPAYNERTRIAEVLERIEALGLDRQIVVVDDGSTDGTDEVLAPWRDRDGVVLLRQENRRLSTKIEQLDGLVRLFPKIVDAEVDLDTPRAIFDLGKGCLAHFTQKANSPGQNIVARFSLPFVKVLQNLGDGVCALHTVGIGVDAPFA